MRKIMSMLLALSASSLALGATSAAIDTAGYLRQHGWRLLDEKGSLKSPVPGVVPLWYVAGDNSAPSCGLLTASPGGKPPGYIELVGPDPDVGFPVCVGIKSMRAFELHDKAYLAIEYLSRETREDTDMHFHYLVRSQAGNFITDEALTGAVPPSPSGMHPRHPVAVKPVDAVRLARTVHLRRAYPAWRFSERDFISDQASSFSIFEDKGAMRCQVVTEAGAAPVATAHTAFFVSACDGVLASSRYEKAGKVYYLALFQTQGGRRAVGVTSVSPGGAITVEQSLSDAINRHGATQNIKAAKATLVREMR